MHREMTKTKTKKRKKKKKKAKTSSSPNIFGDEEAPVPKPPLWHPYPWLVLGASLMTMVLLFFGLAMVFYSVAATVWTEWAPDYREVQFHLIELGDTQEQVLARLGEPLERTIDGASEVWVYTRPEGEAHYWLRTVRFNGAGRVKATQHELHMANLTD
ncbi:hypothetical protein JY651_01240 [Pyxidicoccus parkwayensis]|uniref:Lipoprotein SmpA/OmlA domain-containing protein n=1 Tax=Pyxidicoccus parkwayensis TaxID=2813578 RepID=A0ABX7NXK9_9BACT|nr:hypothetical protein [Pyxidicoccus parkwaysis]QSQ23640.1 hypothetical protein JY651_01240 [Pyxidicoccus parkwaysis]